MTKRKWVAQARSLNLRLYVSRPRQLKAGDAPCSYEVGLSNLSLEEQVVWVGLTHLVDEHACIALIGDDGPTKKVERENIPVTRVKRNPARTQTESLCRSEEASRQGTAVITISSRQSLAENGPYVLGPSVSVTCDTP